MPDRQLRDAYLERLTASLSLPDAERLAAAEEIAAHIDEAMADMQSGGLPPDVAERRALEHLGPPERLADDLTAARRQGSHALAAVGTAVRISIVTGLQYFLLTWAVIIVTAIAVSLAVAGLGRLLGTAVLQADWTPLTAGLFPAVVACAVAYSVGRTILTPVAVSARRPASQMRMPLAVLGVALTAWIAMTVVVAPYHVAGALLMASAPAWFLLGLLRRRAGPAPVLSSRLLIVTLSVFVIGSIGLGLAAGGASSAIIGTEPVTGTESEVYDPNAEYAAVGPFVDLEHPPLAIDQAGGWPLPGPGPGPARIERSLVAPAGFLNGWRDVRLEVWPGPRGQLNGTALDPDATQPLATVPMTVDGRRVTGFLDFRPRPDRDFYYVATTGINAEGVRMQLSWGDITQWRWEGTIIDFVRASLQR